MKNSNLSLYFSLVRNNSINKKKKKKEQQFLKHPCRVPDNKVRLYDIIRF